MDNKNVKFASPIVLAGFVFAHVGFFHHDLAVEEKHIHPEPYTHQVITSPPAIVMSVSSESPIWPNGYISWPVVS